MNTNNFAVDLIRTLSLGVNAIFRKHFCVWFG